MNTNHFSVAARTNLILTNILIYHLVPIFILKIKVQYDFQVLRENIFTTTEKIYSSILVNLQIGIISERDVKFIARLINQEPMAGEEADNTITLKKIIITQDISNIQPQLHV